MVHKCSGGAISGAFVNYLEIKGRQSEENYKCEITYSKHIPTTIVR